MRVMDFLFLFLFTRFLILLKDRLKICVFFYLLKIVSLSLNFKDLAYFILNALITAFLIVISFLCQYFLSLRMSFECEYHLSSTSRATKQLCFAFVSFTSRKSLTFCFKPLNARRKNFKLQKQNANLLRFFFIQVQRWYVNKPSTKAVRVRAEALELYNFKSFK